jgi:hypothetical protein
MTPPTPDLTELGETFYVDGFRPLPDVADNGERIGTRLWRVRTLPALPVRPDTAEGAGTPAAAGVTVTARTDITPAAAPVKDTGHDTAIRRGALAGCPASAGRARHYRRPPIPRQITRPVDLHAPVAGRDSRCSRGEMRPTRSPDAPTPAGQPVWRHEGTLTDAIDAPLNVAPPDADNAPRQVPGPATRPHLWRPRP